MLLTTFYDHNSPKYRAILNGLNEWLIQELISHRGAYGYSTIAETKSREEALEMLEHLKAAKERLAEQQRLRLTILEEVY